MGGFSIEISDTRRIRLYSNEGNDFTEAKNGRLTFKLSGILKLAWDGHFLPMTDQTIGDKSKADSLAKALVYIQVVWFVCQIIQRKVAGLPMSLLEFHVLVNIGCGLVIYTMWFMKPRNVETATTLQVFTVDELLPRTLSDRHRPIMPRLCFQTREDMEDRSETVLALWSCLEKEFRDDGNPAQEENIFVLERLPIGGPEQVTLRLHDPKSTDWALPALRREVTNALRWTPPKTESSVVHAKEEQERPSMSGNNVEAVELKPYPIQSISNDNRVSPQQHDAQMDEAESLSPLLENTPSLKRGQGRIITMARMHGKLFNSYRANFTYARFVFHDDNGGRIFLNLAVFPIAVSAYGAIHLIPAITGFSFPSSAERKMWLISCYMIITFVTTIPITFGGVAVGVVLWPDKQEVPVRWRRRPRQAATTLLGLFYVFLLVGYPLALLSARFYLLVESFISMRKERVEIFQTPDWNWLDYIPHI